MKVSMMSCCQCLIKAGEEEVNALLALHLARVPGGLRAMSFKLVFRFGCRQASLRPTKEALLRRAYEGLE